MKNLLIVALCCFMGNTLPGQSKKTYTTLSGEWIFSFATIEQSGSAQGSRVRYSPVFNLQNSLHVDAWKNVGFFTGVSVRNVGFIYGVPNTSVTKKYRTYNLGIPVGFKIGNLNKAWFFAGYELEVPVNYKEKTFVDERKTDKFNVWFSKRTPALMHSLIAGIQLPKGASFKVKYYLTGFFNKDFQATDEFGNSYKPFENFNAHVFYLSFNFMLMKNRKLHRVVPKKEPVFEAFNE